MTYKDAFSNLSTSLDRFNSVLNESDKLDNDALKIIQSYLNNSTVTILKQEDESKMQRPLKQLELLNDQVTLNRVKSIDMKEINFQIIELAEAIKENPEETQKDAYFTIIRLEVCFLEILSEEAAISSKKWQQFYENKMNVKVVAEPSDSKSYTRAERTYEQQCVVNELMDAVLFDVIEYFQDIESFTDKFNQKFLKLLNQKIENPEQVVEDKTIDDVKQILEDNAEKCELPINYLILELRYAIIGYDERVNQYSIPLLRYITNTESPTLKEFNKTLDFVAALSSEDVQRFEPLFQLYCKDLLSPEEEGPSNAATTGELAVKHEKAIRPNSPPPPPPISCEYDIKIIWIEPFSKDQHKEYCQLLHSLSKEPDTLSANDLERQISKELLGRRIFLCVSATQAHDLLSSIHEKPELYGVYVLCQNEAEEEEIQKETDKFNKIRIATSKEEEFIRKFASDIVPSYTKVADNHYDENENKSDALRWYKRVANIIKKYGDDLMKNNLLPDIDRKIKLCVHE